MTEAEGLVLNSPTYWLYCIKKKLYYGLFQPRWVKIYVFTEMQDSWVKQNKTNPNPKVKLLY